GVFRRLGALAGRYRMRDPRPVAAAGIRAFDPDAAGFEPQRDRALSPAVDPVDHRDLRATLEPRRHLRDDRVDRFAIHREPGLGRHQRHAPTGGGIKAPTVRGAIESAGRGTGSRPWQQARPGFLYQEGTVEPLAG